MTTKTFKDYLKEIMPEFSYTLGIQNKNQKGSVCILKRSGAAGLFFYGDQDIQKLPLTLICSINGNYDETEQAVQKIYENTVYKDDVAFGDFVFSVFPKNNQLPVFLGKSDAGNYEFAIDVDVIYGTK